MQWLSGVIVFKPRELTAVADGLVAWLGGQVAASGAGGLVFGLSGGVDSALLAALAQRALGDRCRALILPCHSAEEDMADAQLVAEAVGIQTFTVNLDAMHDHLVGLLAAAQPAPPGGVSISANTRHLAQANLKPRLRMLAMYYYANLWGWLVAGTTNRAELTIGYFTKFGDGAVDLLPLAGLLKDEIWALSRHLGVPESVVAKPPSAGLWAGQTDEEEMGLNYAQLDAYLRGEPAAPEVAQRVENLAAGSEHKRRRPPAGPSWQQLLDRSN